ncbi:NUDIX domain-containing protein [Paenisporosarcina macmurdoensis]|uniref:NUDIX domain-containing protein n=1 Tax=Paenisporosarcina macmurdoensis TaxID=212659 RepID=A0ABW1LCP8_9BACL
MSILEEEMLAVFDENHLKIGEQSRDIIHRQGLWHETFHCWIVHLEEGIPYLYFQQRSNVKKDFPNLFDITAAGHLLAHESVNDGIREVEEELGLTISMEELQPIGMIKDTILQGEFIDNEFAHTLLLIAEKFNIAFHLQKDEVSGIFTSPLSEVVRLYDKKVDRISLQCITSYNKEVSQIGVTLKDFVPHGIRYMKEVLNSIQEKGEEI